MNVIYQSDTHFDIRSEKCLVIYIYIYLARIMDRNDT